MLGHSVENDVLEENLEDVTSLLIDKATDPLDFGPPSKASDCRLLDALDVVAQHFPMPLRSSIAALASTGHFTERERDLLGF